MAKWETTCSLWLTLLVTTIPRFTNHFWCSLHAPKGIGLIIEAYVLMVASDRVAPAIGVWIRVAKPCDDIYILDFLRCLVSLGQVGCWLIRLMRWDCFPISNSVQ
jgi:hypothetical protein